MKKVNKDKIHSKINSFIFVIIAFAIAPLLINVGLIITDVIYENTGFTLTAYGLNNVEWLDFWKQYLTISISFFGIYLVYISACKDREKRLQESNAQQYLEEVRREENVLVEVVKSFNTSVIYDALLKQEKSDVYEGRKIIAESRANMDHTLIKFELLTELCDDFKKCETCSFSPCSDKTIMVELRNLFYDMEKHYFYMLEVGENFLERLNKEEQIIYSLNLEKKLQNNTENLINVYKSQGFVEEVADSKSDLECIIERIKNLENSKLSLDEVKKYLEIIQKEKDYIDKEARPRFIRYCKVYINKKKKDAMDLRTVGYIKYNKVDEKNNT